MSKLGLRSIRQRLFIFMTIIVLSLLGICLPLILHNYQTLQASKQDLIAIQSLRLLAHTANEISRERAYANRLMSSSFAEQENYRQALDQYRVAVDRDIQKNIDLLQRIGYARVAHELQYDMVPHLKIARSLVDHYARLPQPSRHSLQYDAAVQAMFGAWDSYRHVLREFVIQTNHAETQLSDYITMILLLSDLRDQAGRGASNIIAPLSFKEEIPDTNRARSLQTQYQAVYLWGLIDTLQPQATKTPEYLELHHQVKNDYLDRAIGLIHQLLNESERHEAYSVTGIQLTNQVVDKFSAVVNLQKYLLDVSLNVAQTQKRAAQQKFALTLLLSVVALGIVLMIMNYVQRRIINPLIKAREQILQLSEGTNDHAFEFQDKKDEFASLFSAIQKLQKMMQQRDVLEFQLRNIANTDALTGVSNRLALDDYLMVLSVYPQKLSHLCLMIIDIDNFKRVNDEHGHIVGDQVIQLVAEILKASVRSSDLMVRYGGDEFLVLVEDIPLEHAFNLAEKIRLRLSQKEIDLPDFESPLQVSVSIGVAVGADNWLALLQKADQALLRAKAKGKNVVEL